MEHSANIYLWDFICDYSIFFSMPLLAGFISMIVRSLPYASTEGLDQIVKEAIAKEISAALNGYLNQPLDYSGLFADDCPPVTQYDTADATTKRMIGASMVRAVRQTSRQIWVPRLGRKTISPRFRPYHKPFDKYTDDEVRTILDVERVYTRTGWMLSGRTELRYAWKPNDLKPRVYYARGPDTHFKGASIIHKLFNSLVDALSITHRRYRYQLSTLDRISKDDLIMIYDYSSFTSNLQEIRRFTQVLANRFRGIRIPVLDGHTGVVEKDLGDIIEDYNESCNTFPEVDASELLHVEDLVFNHGAGMLGVPGNIASCTLLHGIHLAVIVGAITRGKVVGDDAIGIFLKKDGWQRETIYEAVSALGDIAFEKMEIWNEEDSEGLLDSWDYCKRPFIRLGERIIQGELPVFPTLNYAMGMSCSHHTTRMSSEYSTRRKYINQHNRLLETLSQTFSITDEEREIVRAFSIAAFDYHGLRRNGGYDFSTNYVYGPVFAEDYSFDSFMKSLAPGTIIRIPVTYTPEKPESYRVCTEFAAKSDSVITYAAKVGYLRDTSEYEYRLRMDFPDDYDFECIRSRRQCSRFVVMEVLPSWLVTYLDFTL